MSTIPLSRRNLGDVIGSIVGLDNMFAIAPASPNSGFHRTRSTPPLAGSGKSQTLAFAGRASERADTRSIPGAILNLSQGFSPQDIRTFYDETVGDGSDGAGQCIAIIGTSDVNDQTIALLATQFNLPAFNLTRVVPQGGTNPGIVNGPEQEAELDIEYSHAVAPGAPIRLYLDGGPNPLVDDISAAVSDNACSAINISFTICSPSTSPFKPTLATIFQQAAVAGPIGFCIVWRPGSRGIGFRCGPEQMRGRNDT